MQSQHQLKDDRLTAFDISGHLFSCQSFVQIQGEPLSNSVFPGLHFHPPLNLNSALPACRLSLHRPGAIEPKLTTFWQSRSFRTMKFPVPQENSPRTPPVCKYKLGFGPLLMTSHPNVGKMQIIRQRLILIHQDDQKIRLMVNILLASLLISSIELPLRHRFERQTLALHRWLI
jgi:hypothetical protein